MGGAFDPRACCLARGQAASSGAPIAAYLGFDATAPSLHVGSLLQIMILRHLQKSGHKPLVLMGGGTTKVGDPSGKDESRKLMTYDKIQENIDSISKVRSPPTCLPLGHGAHVRPFPTQLLAERLLLSVGGWVGRCSSGS